jgi:transposase
MTAVLGLDISKETIDACLIDASGEHVKKISNNVRGFEQLKRWLKNRKQKDVEPRYCSAQASVSPATPSNALSW